MTHGLAFGATRNLTQNAAFDAWSSWSPTRDTRIVFASNRSGTLEVYTMTPDGTDVRKVTDEASFGRKVSAPAKWSPDSNLIAYTSRTADGLGGDQIFTIRPDGRGRVQVTNGFNDHLGAWSNDSKRLVFSSVTDDDAMTGRDIYTVRVTGVGLTRLTDSTEEEFRPTWSSDGAKIAYISGQQRHPVTSPNQLYVMNANGTSKICLTCGLGPSIKESPKFNKYTPLTQLKNKIAFTLNQGLYVVDPDGANLRKLSGGERVSHFDWKVGELLILHNGISGTFPSTTSSLFLVNALGVGPPRTIISRSLLISEPSYAHFMPLASFSMGGDRNDRGPDVWVVDVP